MKKQFRLWFLLLAGLSVLFLLDRYYRGEEFEETSLQQTAALERAKDLLNAGLRERILAVEDLSTFMSIHETLPDRETFERYAMSSLSHHSTIRALQYADSDNIIRYIYPLEGNEAAIDLDLMTRPAAPFVSRAKRDRVTTVSDPVVTVQGSRSIVIRSPIFRGEEYLGLAQGVVDIESLLVDTSKALAPRFVMTLEDGAGKTFWSSGEISGPVLTADFQRWRLNVSWGVGQPKAADHTLAVLWSLGLALLMALLFIVNQFARQMNLLSENVKTKTAELLASEIRFRTFFEQASEGILVADVETEKFTYANRAICKLLEYSQRELLQMGVHDIHPQQNLPDILTDFKDMARGKKVLTHETPCLTKGGNIVYADISAAPMEIDGKDCNVGFFRDVTEGVRLRREKEVMEAHLCRAQKLEAIGILAGGIAHDFNNILGIIMGYAELAKEDAPPGTQFEEDLADILIAANRAKELVKQILAFSRQAQVERIPLQIQQLVKEGVKMLRSSIPSTISIVENIDQNIGTIMADPTQVHQILMNLCTNAYQAMEATGGTLSISLRNTFITSDDKELHIYVAPGEYVELVVADTGTGIGPDVIEHIFDPFFTTKEKGKGTGMGLSIIHGIMTDYGGAVRVESQVGRGSAFHAYFPVIGNNEPVTGINEPEEIPKGHERILFVDDEELLAKMGKNMLERLGYHVTVRSSGSEAMEAFTKTPNEFDLVITDQTMPEVTGVELSKMILGIRPDIPIILCTGYSNLIDEDSAKALGIKEFILKPLERNGIAKLIRKILDAS